uniref:G-protein coupled receptors family 1 profile domain-containing protein n=1 Tax=Oryzias latipes TaxID=8090 RepID=A0A3P9IZQ0_ORYLA
AFLHWLPPYLCVLQRPAISTTPSSTSFQTKGENILSLKPISANSLVLFITSFVGTAANSFVILAVYHQKSLQTSVNALVVNLAVIDFLRCTVDCPFLLTIIITMHQGGRVDGWVCDTQMASFYFSSCLQLLTLACISGERYQAVAQPFKESRRKRRLAVLIPLTWTLAVLVAALCLKYLKNSPVYVRCTGPLRGPSSPYDTVGLYMLLPLWAACFAVIIGFYTRIFALLRSHNRKIFDEGISAVKKDPTESDQRKLDLSILENAHKKSEQKQILSIRVAPTQTEPNPLQENSLLTSGEAARCVSVGSEKKTEFKNTLEMSQPLTEHAVEKQFKTQQWRECSMKTEAKASYQLSVVDRESMRVPGVSSDSNGEKEPRERLETVKNPTETTAVSALHQVSSQPPVNDAVKESAVMEGAVCMMPSKAGKERARKKKESKMAKRAGYIIITFLLFWLPLIITIMVNCLIHRNKNTQVSNLDVLSVSVACITSLSDPMIYAAVNPQFRSEFYKLKNWVKSKVK